MISLGRVNMPFPKIGMNKTYPKPISSFTLKENNIDLAVSEILRYKQTYRNTDR